MQRGEITLQGQHPRELAGDHSTRADVPLRLGALGCVGDVELDALQLVGLREHVARLVDPGDRWPIADG
ncbi:MAG: hypothetical protein WKG01_36350 [Kofleriaceae bacterium]